MTLIVRRTRCCGGYAVFEGSKQISGRFGNWESAERRLEAIRQERRKSTRRQRPCITCGAPFMSEGAHHRMCKGCRGKSEGFEARISGLPGNRSSVRRPR